MGFSSRSQAVRDKTSCEDTHTDQGSVDLPVLLDFQKWGTFWVDASASGHVFVFLQGLFQNLLAVLLELDLNYVNFQRLWPLTYYARQGTSEKAVNLSLLSFT